MSAWTILTTVAVMAFLAFAVSTFAAPATVAVANPDKTVASLSFADLDLASEAGATAALARVERAVRVACGMAPSPTKSTLAAKYRRCVSATVDPALVALSDPVVAAVDTRNRDLLMFVASR